MRSSSSNLVNAVVSAFGEGLHDAASGTETLKRIFRVSVRVDVAKVVEMNFNLSPIEPQEGQFQLRIEHLESGTIVESSPKEEPKWFQSYVIGPVNLRDSIQFALLWKPKANKLLQMVYGRILGAFTVSVSRLIKIESSLRPIKFNTPEAGVLWVSVRLWRDPKRGYISHVILMLTLLKEPIRLVNKLSWASVWSETENALIQAHSLGLTECAVLTARFHTLSIAASKIPPNYLLSFETLSQLRRLPMNPFEDKVIELCRKLNKAIAESLRTQKSLLRCATDYDRMQLVGMLGCCTLIEDVDLTVSKEHFKLSLVAEVTVYFDEWLNKLTSLKGQPREFLEELQKMMVHFSASFGSVNEVIVAAWGEHVTEFLSEPAKKFIMSFRDLAISSGPDESFDIYRIVTNFCRHFHVKLNIEHCFAASTVLQWFQQLYDHHEEWIRKIVELDDFSPIAREVLISCGFRDFRDLLQMRLCSIYRLILVKPAIITNKFVETLCACCQCFCKQTNERLIKENFFCSLDISEASRRFAFALNGVSECYEMLLQETVRIREQVQGAGNVKGLTMIAGGSSIKITKTQIECKTRELVEGFLSRVAFYIRKLMQNIADSSTQQEVETRAMNLSEFLDKLLGGLCSNLNRMVFMTVLETLFRCCVEVLGSIAGQHRTWSPWQARRNASALIECAKLIRACFYNPSSSNTLPQHKVDTPEFIWLESKLETLARK